MPQGEYTPVYPPYGQPDARVICCPPCGHYFDLSMTKSERTIGGGRLPVRRSIVSVAPVVLAIRGGLAPELLHRDRDCNCYHDHH